MIDFARLGIHLPYTSQASTNVKTFCPKCHNTRRDRRDKSLSVNIRTGLYHCHYCGFSGSAEVNDGSDGHAGHLWQRPQRIAKTDYKTPAPRENAAPGEKALAWFESRGISAQTVADFRITEGMEWMPQKGGKANTVQFNYYLGAKLVNTKYRTGDKCFRLEGGARLIPYNIDAIRDTPECIITEGEMDALSFAEIGRKDVVSVPNGANANLSWLDDFMEDVFDRKEQIYIAVDTDDKGLALREELLRRFGVDRCRVVTYGDDCKDANDLLMRHGAEALRRALAEAEEFRMEGVFEVSDFEDSLDSIYHNGLQRGVTIGIPCIDELISFETKRLCIVTGIPGSGKSEFIDEMAERLNMRYGWKFAYFSPENFPVSYHASKLASKLTGRQFDSRHLSMGEYEEAKRHINDNFFFINPEDAKVDTILEKARFLVRRKGIKCLVIDPFNRLEADEGDRRSETLQISAMLDKLTRFAQQNDVLIILMAHPTKLHSNRDGVMDSPTLYDISGSAHFFNKADFGMVVHRDRSVGNVLVKVEKVKFRHLGNTGKARLSYNLANGRYAAYAADGKTEWDDTNHLAALRHERESEVKANAHFPESWFAPTAESASTSDSIFGTDHPGLKCLGLPDMPGSPF